MAPFRNAEREQAANHPYASTSSLEGRSRGKSSAASQGFPGAIPTGSLSKLKAQLRQTKRLLTRDDLTPDVKITSERRLKTLELEIEKATVGALEQKMVTKYRGIKFFERQKVLRKIKQAKKALLLTPNDATLQQTLFESRIDLHYILRYVKTEKYIALFPDGTYMPHATAITISPPTTAPTPKAKVDAATTRAHLRQSLKDKVSKGELEVEAEGGNLVIEGVEDVGQEDLSNAPVVIVETVEVASVAEPFKRVKKVKIAAAAPVVEMVVDIPATEEPKKKKSKKERAAAKAAPVVPIAPEEGWVAEGDDFFA